MITALTLPSCGQYTNGRDFLLIVVAGVIFWTLTSAIDRHLKHRRSSR